MTARFSYGESRLDRASAKKLAEETVAEICEIIGEVPEGTAECCDVNARARSLEIVLVRDLKCWAALLDVKGKTAKPLHDLAAWKIERLVLGLMAIEEALLEREPMGDDEQPEAGRRVMHVEVRP